MKAQAAQEKPVKKEISDNKHKSNGGNKGGYEKNLIKMSLRMKILYWEEIFKEIL